MVRNAEETARDAEKTLVNIPGTCLMWSRQRADIPAKYADAATSWRYATNRKRDRNPPRGAFVFWVGGSRGFGHISVSLGNGMIRSSDAGGAARVATVPLGWVEAHWTNQRYVGWTDNVNGVTVPGVGESATKNEDDDDMDVNDKITNWSPDDGSNGKISVGQTLNQARGYSEDAYQRIKRLEQTVAHMEKVLDQIAAAVKK